MLKLSNYFKGPKFAFLEIFAKVFTFGKFKSAKRCFHAKSYIFFKTQKIFHKKKNDKSEKNFKTRRISKFKC